MNFSESAFRIYFRRMYPQLAFYAARLVGEEDVDDLLQEAFLELWTHQEQVEDEAHCKSYLYRVIYTRALNVIKHRKVTRKYQSTMKDVDLKRLEYYEPAENSVAERVEDGELQAMIEEAINELPEKGRQVFIMSYLNGMRSKEIAYIMGISVRTVDVHIYRALKFLRSRLSKYHFLLLIFLPPACKLFSKLSCNILG